MTIPLVTVELSYDTTEVEASIDLSADALPETFNSEADDWTQGQAMAAAVGARDAALRYAADNPRV